MNIPNENERLNQNLENTMPTSDPSPLFRTQAPLPYQASPVPTEVLPTQLPQAPIPPEPAVQGMFPQRPFVSEECVQSHAQPQPQPQMPVAPTQPVAPAHSQMNAAHIPTSDYPTGASAHVTKKANFPIKTFFVAFAGAALAVLIGLVGFGIYQQSVPTATSSTVIGSSASQSVEVNENTTLAEAVSSKALPSVVNIDVYTNQSSSNPFGYGGSGLTETSLGSGVVISSDGYLMTNYHVIEGADELMVSIGEDSYPAKVVGVDASSDIAVLKVDGAQNLVPIEIGSSSDLQIGEWVMTIGSPFGLEQSVATGIVSATSRSQIAQSITGSEMIYTNLIQTDAAINPGNSGGALVDAEGKLIGVNTLITSYSGNYSGVGFAIPVDYAINIAQQIIDGKTPSHAQLGVSLSTVDASVAQRYGLSVDAGAYVMQLHEGSAAAAAGIKVGDIITKFNGKDIASVSDLMVEIRLTNAGDKVTVEVNRSGEVHSLDITMGSDSSSLQSSFMLTS